tara:strand:+ start:1063 stop:1551 length:489 start_codon:yes stop_codon:yes gene_type:complete
MAVGKYAKFISDRSGLEFPYNEMMIEWNGSRVHSSEYDPKHPQLEPKRFVAEPQGLRNARPARTEPIVARLLGPNPFSMTSGSTTITVTDTNHGRSTNDTVRFRNVDGSPGGLASTAYTAGSGFSITVTSTDNYTFTLGSTPTITEQSGGMTVTAGPVTLDA